MRKARRKAQDADVDLQPGPCGRNESDGDSERGCASSWSPCRRWSQRGGGTSAIRDRCPHSSRRSTSGSAIRRHRTAVQHRPPQPVRIATGPERRPRRPVSVRPGEVATRTPATGQVRRDRAASAQAMSARHAGATSTAPLPIKRAKRSPSFRMSRVTRGRRYPANPVRRSRLL